MQEVVIDAHPAAHSLAPFVHHGSRLIPAASAPQKMWPLNGHDTMLIKKNFYTFIFEVWLSFFFTNNIIMVTGLSEMQYSC